jgi:protein-S-isoprenylcysteine O-methyltransferase Ste14
MSSNDHAAVVIKPPLLFLGALALGCLLSLLVPLGPKLASPNRLALILGLVLAGIGFALAIVSVMAFRRADTPVVPGRSATALVTSGPYAVTRNPIYIGFVLVYVGLALVLTSWWVALLLIPVLAILRRGVVAREEAYLARKFGDTYSDYAKHVPRWLFGS